MKGFERNFSATLTRLSISGQTEFQCPKIELNALARRTVPALLQSAGNQGYCPGIKKYFETVREAAERELGDCYSSSSVCHLERGKKSGAISADDLIVGGSDSRSD